jgi:glycosyltransferase involved in cell wall biosynthesis
MDLPAVDVIIPARDAARTIEAAVRSVLGQSAPHLRVIVIDDGSTDETPFILARLAEQDARVLPVRRSGLGIAEAMNVGLALTTAPFIARLDADDLSAPDRHARQLRHLVGHPGCVACSGAHEEMDGDGRLTGHIHRVAATDHPDPAWLPAREPPLTQPFFMARRSALLAAGGYRPLPVAEDSDLYWRLAEQGRLEVLPAVLGRYRMHGASISSASISHGRQLALWSQIAALSAQRRQAGRADLPLAELGPPGSVPDDPLADQVATAADRFALEPAEAEWLATATAAKLMELAGYRPYELTLEDVHFLSLRLADAPAHLRPMRAATAARLLRARRLAEAMQIGRGHRAEMLARAAANRLYWSKRKA